MAEILGAAASIIAVIQLAGQVTSLGYGYIGSVKRAPKDLRELVRELSSLADILTTLQDHIEANPQSTALQKLGGRDGPLQGCVEDLELLELHIKPKNGTRLGKIDRLIWPLKDTETSQHISRIERHKSRLSLALTTYQLALSNKIEGHVQKTSLAIESLQSESAFRSQQDEMRYTKEKRLSALDWIYPENVSIRHDEIRRLRQKNTGEWLLKSLQFKKLMECRDANFLWGYGIPGAGKTYLSCFVIDYLEKMAPTANYGVAHIYFDYSHRENRQAVHVLACLIKQLAYRKPQLPKAIEDLYDDLTEKGSTPTLEQLYGTLLSIIELYDRTFCVFDALDEYDLSSQRGEILSLVHRMRKDGISFFVTSREYPDIQESFRNMPKIKLSANQDDIRKYILEKINGSTTTKRLVRDNQCQDQIVSVLTDCSKGMFLLVHLHIGYICQQITKRQILTVLERLQNSDFLAGNNRLEATYDRIMESVHDQPSYNIKMAMRIFSWLIEAYRTLTVSELQLAIAIELQHYSLDEDLLDKETILEICAGLVTIDEASDNVRLVHHTAKDYLLAKHITHQEAQFQVIGACTTYLSFDEFAEGALRSSGPASSRSKSPMPVEEESHPTKTIQDRLKSNLLLRYASRYFHQHIINRDLRDQDERLLTEMVLKLLDNPGHISSYAQLSSWRPRTVRGVGKFRGWFPSIHASPEKYSIPPLHVASDLGYYIIVQELLLKKGVDVSTSDRSGCTALHRAAYRGHQAVVQLLIENGADVSARDKGGEQAIHLSAYRGHRAVVELLLQKGAYVSAPNNFGEMPLHRSAYNGHEAVVLLLLENGAKISASDNEGNTALHWSALNGHQAVVRLLLEKGAEILASDSSGNNPLHLAASSGYQEVVQLLLEKGARLSVQNNDGDTALHCSAANGHQAVVQLLVDKGANLSLPDDNGNTCLHLSAFGGHQECVQLLLENNTNLRALNNKGETPLRGAAANGHRFVVKLLLENSADTSTPDEKGRTALHASAFKGHYEITQLLLENGADVSAPGEEGRTPLHCSAFRGHLEITELLLKNGADISALTYRGRTALHSSAGGGHLEVAQLLLENGADVSLSGEDGRTPLHCSAYRGYLELVKLLLQSGADISALTKRGRTALHDSASGGHLGVTRLLIEKGADILVSDEQGMTALHWSAFGGYHEVVQLLLKSGANVSTPNNRGHTALHLSVIRGHQTVALLLLEKGADISATDNEGQTALQLAGQSERDAMVIFLENWQKGVSVLCTLREFEIPNVLHPLETLGLNTV